MTKACDKVLYFSKQYLNKIYLHNTAYTTARVIKAMQDRPQPTISVTDGTPEYSIACELDKSSSDFECLVIKKKI